MSFDDLIARCADGRAPEQALHSLYVGMDEKAREHLFLSVVAYALMQRGRRLAAKADAQAAIFSARH